MDIRFAVLAALAATGFGCATPPEQPQTAGASASMPIRSRAAITGSRLAPLDNDDPGAAHVGAVTGDDWRGNEATRVKILCGENPAACAGGSGARVGRQ